MCDDWLAVWWLSPVRNPLWLMTVCMMILWLTKMLLLRNRRAVRIPNATTCLLTLVIAVAYAILEFIVSGPARLSVT